MPAAFPALTTTSPEARMEVCAGAIRVSWATGLPSRVIETQLVSSARMSRLKVLGGFTAAADVVPSASAGLARGAFAEGAGAEPRDCAWVGSVGAAFEGGGGTGNVIEALVAGDGADAVEIVPGENFPDDNVFAGDAFATVRVGAEAETGVGD